MLRVPIYVTKCLFFKENHENHKICKIAARRSASGPSEWHGAKPLTEVDQTMPTASFEPVSVCHKRSAARNRQHVTFRTSRHGWQPPHRAFGGVMYMETVHLVHNSFVRSYSPHRPAANETKMISWPSITYLRAPSSNKSGDFRGFP